MSAPPLRPYQHKVIEKVAAEVAAGRRRLLVVAPTGAGKTVIAAEIVRRAVHQGQKALFVSHRREINSQTLGKLFSVGIDAGVIQAGHPARPGEPVQVASIATLHARAIRSSAMEIPDADLVVVDEAHHVRARTYQQILASYPQAIVIGLTATPCRGDGRGLGNAFEVIVECAPVSELINGGFLVSARIYAPSQPDLTGIKVERGDYVERQLAERIDRPELVGDIVSHWLRLSDRRVSVVFATGVAHSLHLRDEFRRSGVMAEHIDGSTPVEERDAILARLATGAVEVICNAMVLTEGWDCPEVSCLVLARPTKSLGLYRQMVGRVLRPAAGKTDALILDHAGAVFAHGFPDDHIAWTLREDRRAENKTHAARGTFRAPALTNCPDPTGRAGRICRFVRKLRLWEGDFAGQSFTLNPFQEAIIRRIYGPSTPDGRRLVRMACIWIPRGNAKTTLAAALGLGHFLGPEAESGGQAVLAAADRENAGIAFNSAWQMVQQDDALLSRVRPVESRKVLTHPGTRSTLKAISHEAYSKHGLNVSFFLADEVHAWPPAEARKLFKVVTDSMVKRSNPLTVIISTAGEGQGGLAWDLWDYSHKIAAGEIDDPTFAPIIFAAPPEADWRDEAAWHAANPAIEAGFCSLEELRIKARRIEHFPAEIADFRRFHLNQWIEGAAAPWIDLGLYDKAEPMTDPDALLGQPCYVGVDLSSVEDLTAVVAVFPDGAGENRSFDVLATFFLPATGLARKAELDRADYLRWKADRYLRVTDGNRVDQAAIMAHVVELARLYDVREVAIDRWNSTAVTTALQAEGITVAEFGQGFASMAAPVKELKRAILGGQFRHGGNPVLRMCFGNVVAGRDDAENEKFTKEKSRGRIDGTVAAAMAIGRALANESGPSIYETGRPDGFLYI